MLLFPVGEWTLYYHLCKDLKTPPAFGYPKEVKCWFRPFESLLTNQRISPTREGKGPKGKEESARATKRKRRLGKERYRLLVNRYQYRYSLICMQCFKPIRSKQRADESGLRFFCPNPLLLLFLVGLATPLYGCSFG